MADNTLIGMYGKNAAEMMKFSRAADKIDETKVYEEANLNMRAAMNKLLSDNFLPGTGIKNIENLKALYDAVVKEGKKGLILMEHYSNVDLPSVIYLLENYGEEWAADLANRIVAVAGMKLNESSPFVRVFTEGYSRVVIYPTRSLESVGAKSELTEEQKAEEEKRARKINFAAMRAMDDCKKRGQVILVFPSGTRYRPGKPETKMGLREIDSYLRLFDVMCLIGSTGNCLRINPEDPENMTADLVVPDVITLKPSKLIDCKEFREDVLKSLPADCPDPKQETVNAIMAKLDEMHNS